MLIADVACSIYRVAAAAELTELHDRLNVEVKKLQEIHTARYIQGACGKCWYSLAAINTDMSEY